MRLRRRYRTGAALVDAALPTDLDQRLKSLPLTAAALPPDTAAQGGPGGGVSQGRRRRCGDRCQGGLGRRGERPRPGQGGGGVDGPYSVV